MTTVNVNSDHPDDGETIFVPLVYDHLLGNQLKEILAAQQQMSIIPVSSETVALKLQFASLIKTLSEGYLNLANIEEFEQFLDSTLADEDE